MIAFNDGPPVHYWNNYKSIACRRIINQTDLPQFLHLNELHLTIINETSLDMNVFSRVSVLTLFNLHNPLNLASLAAVPNLTLGDYQGAADFSIFSSQKLLRLCNCSGLNDESSFRSIRIVKLIRCPNLRDVSQLNGVYDLSLCRCEGIRDISGLGNHHRLELKQLSRNVKGFDCLLHIPHVHLVECLISDMNVLQYARSVRLLRCKKASNVGCLRNVKELEIYSDVLLVGLEELVEVPDLSLTLPTPEKLGNDLISRFKNRRLHITAWNIDFKSLEVFSVMIKHLDVRESTTFAQFINQGQGSRLKHLHSLVLCSMSLIRLTGLGDIPKLRLGHCHGLRTLQGLGGNRCVEVISCEELEDVRSLVTVPIVTIKGCMKLKEEDYNYLKNVSRLNIQYDGIVLASVGKF